MCFVICKCKFNHNIYGKMGRLLFKNRQNLYADDLVHLGRIDLGKSVDTNEE